MDSAAQEHAMRLGERLEEAILHQEAMQVDFGDLFYVETPQGAVASILSAWLRQLKGKRRLQWWAFVYARVFWTRGFGDHTT